MLEHPLPTQYSSSETACLNRETRSRRTASQTLSVNRTAAATAQCCVKKAETSTGQADEELDEGAVTRYDSKSNQRQRVRILGNRR